VTDLDPTPHLSYVIRASRSIRFTIPVNGSTTPIAANNAYYPLLGCYRPSFVKDSPKSLPLPLVV